MELEAARKALHDRNFDQIEKRFDGHADFFRDGRGFVG